MYVITKLSYGSFVSTLCMWLTLYQAASLQDIHCGTDYNNIVLYLFKVYLHHQVPQGTWVLYPTLFVGLTSKLKLIHFIDFFRLWRLYNNLEANSPLRYHVYYHVIELAARVGCVREVFTGVDQLRKEFAACPPTNEQMQKLYRLLHQVLKDQNRYGFPYL